MGQNEEFQINLGIYFCQNGASMNQVFSLTKTGQLRREKFCIIGSSVEGSIVKMRTCSEYQVLSEQWSHMREGPIMNKESGRYYISL